MAHPVDKGYLSPTDITGTAFLVDNGQANESAPAAITLGADSGVRGVTIVHQARRVPGEMIPFPSAILGKGDRCYVEGCDLIDPFLAIKMDHVDDYLIKDIYTGTDHLGVQVVGGKGGIIENFAAHGQFLAAGIPHTWGMPKYPSTIAQLQKTTTAIQIEGATDQLVQACGQYGLRNGYIVQGGPDGKPCTVLFRLVTDDSVTGDGLRLEGNARIVAIGYENLTTYLAKSLVTTPSFSGDALLAGDILRTMILSCAGTGRTEVRGATILWVPGKVYVDGGRVFVRASLSNITNVTVAPDAAFRAEANIDERNALQTARTSNCMFVSNAAVAK